MLLCWTDDAWADYLYWQSQDRRTLKRVNALIRDMQRTPFEGIGKPEPLRWGLSGAWSRRIDSANRIIYTVADDRLCILSGPLLNDMGRNGLYHLIDVFGRLGFL